MASHSWKALERKVASFLGGNRIYRGDNFSESRPDVIAPIFNLNPSLNKGTVLAECKYSRYQPWISNKTLIKSKFDKDVFICSNKNGKEIFVFFKLELINKVNYLDLFNKIHKLSKKQLKNYCDANKNVGDVMLDYSLQAESYITCDYVKQNNHGEPYLPIVVLGKSNSPVKLAYFNIKYIGIFING